MKTSTARRLVQLNHDFYARFAGEFAASRSALPDGILHALDALAGCRSLLDVGCGDGRVARVLARRRGPRRVERYRGVDQSAELLRRLIDASPPLPPDYRAVLADITRPGWSRQPALGRRRFEAAVCFASLFHVPGPRRRLRLLREVRALLAADGRAAVSVWRLLHVPRLRRKVVPWREVGIAPAEVERGDLLVDWRRGGRGLRYVHHFEAGELEDLCRRAGFAIVDDYLSDGATGDMSRFLLLEVA
jgi:SAM-dependent methyltransferase